MFIKFGDKTKKIIVKKSKDESQEDDLEGYDVIYLDDISDDNLKKKILEQYEVASKKQ